MYRLFHRTSLAACMVQQLLNPGVLDTGVRSGLFISGPRRTGKTTFLRNDLVPALQQQGAVVIYVDLWSNVQAEPADLVHDAVRQAMHQLQSHGTKVRKALGRVSAIDLGAGPIKFGYKVDKVGAPGGITLAQALAEVVDKARTDLVLIVDEVQHAVSFDSGRSMLMALKAARDAINMRPATPGHFLFVGTGSHRAQVAELAALGSHAFAGAVSVDFPLLGEDFVDDLLAQLTAVSDTVLPSRTAAMAAFELLGHLPEEMSKAVRQLQQIPAGSDPDAMLPVIAAALRATLIELELAKVERLGSLAVAIFDGIVRAGEGGCHPAAADALASYAAMLGRPVGIEEVQALLNELLAANLVTRRGIGQYAASDPQAAHAWRLAPRPNMRLV